MNPFIVVLTIIKSVNSLWPSDTIWRQGSGSTLAQVMACCLTAPSHYLNQCWLIISKVQWHSSEGTVTTDTSAMNHLNYPENYLSEISLKLPRGQWVKPVAGMFWWNGGPVLPEEFSFHCKSAEVMCRTSDTWEVSTPLTPDLHLISQDPGTWATLVDPGEHWLAAHWGPQGNTGYHEGLVPNWNQGSCTATAIGMGL